MPTKHYRYGGSTIHRTFACSGWRFLADKLPHDDSSSDAAKLGTALHTCMENYLEDGTKPRVNDVVEGVTITADHIFEKFIPAAKATEELFTQYGLTEIIPEHMADISDIVGGSMDVVASGDDYVMVLDYKFGDGYLVDAEDNKQLLFYAAMAALDNTKGGTGEYFTDDKKLLLVIVQPTPRKDVTHSVWEVDMSLLDTFIELLYTAIDTAEAQNDKNLVTNAGPWCAFCPAAAICPTKTGMAERALRLDVTNPELVPVINDALIMADQLDSWIKEVRKLAYKQASHGVQFESYKLVDKAPRRKWIELDHVEELVRKTGKLKKSECYPATLISPAQMEKLCKLKGVDFDKFSDYIGSSSSGTTLALRTDKRPEALSTAALAALAARLG